MSMTAREHQSPFSPLSFHGRVELPVIESEVLQGNALGDPHLREVPVYLPPDADSGSPLPVVFVLPGFTGRGHSMLETHPWKGGVVQHYDRLVAAGQLPPAILVLPDCFTRLGGSQYVNSSATGDYADHVAEELVRFVDERYPTSPNHRAIMGKSSGGFGALHLCMRYPGVFRAAASISGDCHFEFGYAMDFLNGVRGLEAYGRDPHAFLEAFARHPDLGGDGHAVLNLLAMSACYSPDPASPLGFQLPVDLETGERIKEVWQRWLAFDPVLAVHEEQHASALRELDLLYLEAGRRDEFHLQFSLRVLARQLNAVGVPFEHHEHEGGHFGLDARVPDVLARVLQVVHPG